MEELEEERVIYNKRCRRRMVRKKMTGRNANTILMVYMPP